MLKKSRPAYGSFIFFFAAFGLAGYFTFAAVQGDYGIFERAEADAEVEQLNDELSKLNEQVAALENLTKRLSDDFLDLDLLDERARIVLGMARADEILIQ